MTHRVPTPKLDTINSTAPSPSKSPAETWEPAWLAGAFGLKMRSAETYPERSSEPLTGPKKSTAAPASV